MEMDDKLHSNTEEMGRDSLGIHKGARCLWNKAEGTWFSDQMPFVIVSFSDPIGFPMLPIL